MSTDPVEYLDRPGLRRLWDAASARVARLGRVGGRITLDDASDGERAAIADLCGWRVVPRGPLIIALEELDTVLSRSRFGLDLRGTLERLRGPIRDLPAEREVARRRWQTVLAAAASHRVLVRHPELQAWLDDLAATGLLRRLGRDEPARLLDETLAVLDRLPLRTPRPLPEAAADLLGHSHALDPSTPHASLVLRALAVLHAQPLPASAEARRALWDRAGIVCDDLSCDVLVLNLHPTGDDLVSDQLRAAAAVGLPRRLTLREIARIAAPFTERALRIVENPAVLSAASLRLGVRCPPLLCTGGFPNTAAMQLIRAHAEAGATLHYHGDFDHAGLRVARVVWDATGFQPWRFGAEDYRRAAHSSSITLEGAPADSPWEPGLAIAMAELGVAVEQEHLLDSLLGDLGSAPVAGQADADGAGAG